MADTIDIKWLTDKDGNKFYPRTNTNAITNDEGTPLEEILANIKPVADRVIDGGSARTRKLNLAVRKLNGGTAADRI